VAAKVCCVAHLNNIVFALWKEERLLWNSDIVSVMPLVVAKCCMCVIAAV